MGGEAQGVLVIGHLRRQVKPFYLTKMCSYEHSCLCPEGTSRSPRRTEDVPDLAHKTAWDILQELRGILSEHGVNFALSESHSGGDHQEEQPASSPIQ